MQCKKVYVCEEEWRHFGWTRDFDDAKRFKSINEALDFMSEIKDEAINARGTEWYIAFGKSEEDHLISFEKIVLTSTVVLTSPESKLRQPSDQALKAIDDPEYQQFLTLKAKFEK